MSHPYFYSARLGRVRVTDTRDYCGCYFSDAAEAERFLSWAREAGETDRHTVLETSPGLIWRVDVFVF